MVHDYMTPDIAALVGRLRAQAESTSKAHRMMAEAKSLRQTDNPESRSDLYRWLKPDETIEAQAADALTRLSAEVGRVERERDRWRRSATDREYMLAAVVQMLGSKGREVWALWQQQGIVRLHTSWIVDPMTMDGEEVAKLHLQTEEAIATARPLDFGDAAALAPASSEGEG